MDSFSNKGKLIRLNSKKKKCTEVAKLATVVGSIQFKII